MLAKSFDTTIIRPPTTTTTKLITVSQLASNIKIVKNRIHPIKILEHQKIQQNISTPQVLTSKITSGKLDGNEPLVTKQ
jgi:hypothetical protein